MFLAEKLKNITECEHRIWPVKCKYGLSLSPYTWTPKAHTSLRGTPIQAERARVKGSKSFYSCSVCFYGWIDADASWIGFAMISRVAPWIELQRMCRKAQFIACSPLRITRILALFVFIDELMLTHHELASPWFLALLHELNCNQCAVRHNSCRRQFMKARLSIHATARLQFIAWYS